MASATSPPLPAWPQLMTLDLACAYTSLSANSFRLLAGKYGVQPVECAGLAVTRYRKADLDRLVDSLPLKDAPTQDPAQQPQAPDPALAALERAQRRARPRPAALGVTLSTRPTPTENPTGRVSVAPASVSAPLRGGRQSTTTMTARRTLTTIAVAPLGRWTTPSWKST